eukprot:3130723-Rhodomonas_salina.2
MVAGGATCSASRMRSRSCSLDQGASCALQAPRCSLQRRAVRFEEDPERLEPRLAEEDEEAAEEEGRELKGKDSKPEQEGEAGEGERGAGRGGGAAASAAAPRSAAPSPPAPCCGSPPPAPAPHVPASHRVPVHPARARLRGAQWWTLEASPACKTLWRRGASLARLVTPWRVRSSVSLCWRNTPAERSLKSLALRPSNSCSSAASSQIRLAVLAAFECASTSVSRYRSFGCAPRHAVSASSTPHRRCCVRTRRMRLHAWSWAWVLGAEHAVTTQVSGWSAGERGGSAHLGDEHELAARHCVVQRACLGVDAEPHLQPQHAPLHLVADLLHHAQRPVQLLFLVRVVAQPADAAPSSTSPSCTSSTYLPAQPLRHLAPRTSHTRCPSRIILLYAKYARRRGWAAHPARSPLPAYATATARLVMKDCAAPRSTKHPRAKSLPPIARPDVPRHTT